MTKRRFFQNAFPYLITIKIINNFEFFENEEFATCAYEILLESAKQYGVTVYAFVVMPDHIHLLCKTSSKTNIADYLRNYKSYVYYQIKNRFDFKDKFWQNRYDFRIKDSPRLFEIAVKYVLDNPRKSDLPAKYLNKPYIYQDEKLVNREIKSWLGFKYSEQGFVPASKI